MVAVVGTVRVSPKVDGDPVLFHPSGGVTVTCFSSRLSVHDHSNRHTLLGLFHQFAGRIPTRFIVVNGPGHHVDRLFSSVDHPVPLGERSGSVHQGSDTVSGPKFRPLQRLQFGQERFVGEQAQATRLTRGSLRVTHLGQVLGRKGRPVFVDHSLSIRRHPALPKLGVNHIGRGLYTFGYLLGRQRRQCSRLHSELGQLMKSGFELPGRVQFLQRGDQLFLFGRVGQSLAHHFLDPLEERRGSLRFRCRGLES